MLAAKEAHKLALKKQKAQWFELLMESSDSDDDDENNADSGQLSNLMHIYDHMSYDTTSKRGIKTANLNIVVPKSERDKLKTNTFRKSTNLAWIEGSENN